MDRKIIEDQIAGQIAKSKLLREDEAIFLKVQGINETIVKTEVTRDKNITLLGVEKKIKKVLLGKKTDAVSGAAKNIIEKMNEVLPEKNAAFDCMDGLVFGMRNDDGSVTAYNGLSGYQTQSFGAALSNLLDANILIIECAEVDNIRMAAMIEDLSGSDKQIILNTHIAPFHEKDNPKGYHVSDDFKIVEL